MVIGVDEQRGGDQQRGGAGQADARGPAVGVDGQPVQRGHERCQQQGSDQIAQGVGGVGGGRGHRYHRERVPAVPHQGQGTDAAQENAGPRGVVPAGEFLAGPGGAESGGGEQQQDDRHIQDAGWSLANLCQPVFIGRVSCRVL